MPINAVAAAVGYQDQLAFSKIFKQNFTVSPKEYRKAKEELQLGTVKVTLPHHIYKKRKCDMTQVTAYTNEGRYKCLEDLPIDSAELSLGYCGWERCYPGHRFGPNKRTYYVLHIITNGKGKLERMVKYFI